MSYKITIIDTDTKKVIVDEEATCIIGAARAKDTACGFALTCCNPIDVATTILATREQIKKLRQSDPMIDFTVRLTDGIQLKENQE